MVAGVFLLVPHTYLFRLCTSDIIFLDIGKIYSQVLGIVKDSIMYIAAEANTANVIGIIVDNEAFRLLLPIKLALVIQVLKSLKLIVINLLLLKFLQEAR